jgi:hypothetical protein
LGVTIRALLPEASSDAKAILARRKLPFAILTVALALIAAIAVTAKNQHGLNQLLDTIGGAVFGFTIFADTMRIVQSDYRLDAGRVARLMWYGFLLLLLILACFVPFIVVLDAVVPHAAKIQPWKTVSIVVLEIIFILLSARFAFLCFLCEQEDARAFVLSWRLTKGPTFFPTLVASAAYIVPLALFAFVFDAMQPHVPLAFPAVSHEIIYAAFYIVAGSLFYPLMLRWMIACERVHPESSAGFGEALA